MKLKHLELLRKLPVPFDTVVDWMNGKPPHPLYQQHDHALETNDNVAIFIDDAIEYLDMGMIRPQELIDLSYFSLVAFRKRYPTIGNPNTDPTMRELAAVVYQLVSNTRTMMDNIKIGACGSPLAHEFVVMLKIYPHP